MNASKQFVLSGYYGCGNAGDEAVLAGIRASFARQTGDLAQLVVLSQNPYETTIQHHLRSVYRMNLSSLRQVLRESDMLLSGGGSLLQDTTSMRSLLYYLWVARLAYSMGVPVMFYAQGLGPLRRTMARSLVRMVANRAAAITVRDEPSAKLLTAIGVTNPAVEVTADPAFALTPADHESVDTLMTAEGLPLDEPLIGVALRPWGGTGESPVDSYARLLESLATRCRARVVLLPMHAADDVSFAEEVVGHTQTPEKFPIVRRVYPSEVLLGLVGRMQAMVAMRLHALIFAARTAVPPFALSYDLKVESLMRSLDLGDCLEHWRGFDPDETAERVEALLAQRECRVVALRGRQADLEERALRNADIALAATERNPPLLRLPVR